MKIAILGGTFDPVHNGHLALAEQAIKTFNLDKVIFMPAYKTTSKASEEISPAEDRYSMLKAAISGNDKFEASRLEINRRNISYSIDTISYLKKIYPKDAQIFFLIGSDSLSGLDAWKDVDKLMTMCKFIAGARPGFALEAKYKNMEIMTMQGLDVSSTQIRQLVKANKDITGLVPDEVADYIKRFKFYR
jgi:nicotinate-nucleotide adenylyltransferase